MATADECRMGGRPPQGKFCPFDYKAIFNNRNEDCTVNNKFGYEKGTPCVLLKINKVCCQSFFDCPVN